MSETGWKMPHVDVGQHILWRWSIGARDPSVGIVTSVGDQTINCHLLVQQQRDFTLKVGVRHKDDPFLRRSQTDMGVWEMLPREVRVNEMLSAWEERQKARNLAVVGQAGG